MNGRDPGRAQSFGAWADLYEQTRSSYAPELVADLKRPDPRRILDIGCGTGKAARLFLDAGRDVVGVEPDQRMAAIARSLGITVEDGTFEAWDARGRRFDLLISGQAWHWVDQSVAPGKAAEVLVPGGRFAAFWNAVTLPPEVWKVAEPIYREDAPDLLEDSVSLGTDSRGRPTIYDDALRATGRFEAVERRSYPWARQYSPETWVGELQTHSDQQQLPPERFATIVAQLLEGLAEVDRFEAQYRTLLLTAVRA